jgi:hypothetical protein
MKAFYRNAEIEAAVDARLMEMERAMGKPLSLPIPIDYFAEQVLGLDLLWDEVEELPGELILGAILPEKKLIILNERRREHMDACPGLERSTKGHEAGHWDLFVDKATLGHPVLFSQGDDGPFALRSSGVGEVAVIKMLESSPEGRAVLKEIDKRADEPDEARAVNRYAAAVSMPRTLIEEEIKKIDRTNWPALYELKDKFDVTISALVVRLQQLDLLYVKGKLLFEHRDQATGQARLFE